MKALPLLLIVVIFFLPTSVFPGQIYGTVTILIDGKKFVRKNIKIEIVPYRNTDKTYRAVTDKYGSYGVYVKERGKCKLTVYYDDSSDSIDISSYKNPVRYNLILEKRGKKYHLRRR